MHEQIGYVKGELKSDEEEEGLTAEQVEEALQNLSAASDVCIELVAQFATKGCGCSRKCSSQFIAAHIRNVRAQCYELSHDEVDMVLLGRFQQ